MFETPYKLRYSIWLPFSLFIILLVVIISVYYPIQQENLFRENKKKQLTELSKTVALGVTISLDINNYTGLKKTIDFVTQSSDFEFAAIVSIDSATKKETLFTVFPENYSKYVFTRDNTKFLYAENDFKSKNMSGRIILAASQKTINNAVIEINTPIYFILAIALAIMLIVNFLIARKIAKPILELTEASKTLSKGNFEIEININDEIEELQQLGLSLDTLRKGLQEERKINVELTNSLEETVKIRTKDLSIAREKLEEASKIAQLGQFEYRFEDKTWSSSVLLDQILGINANYPKDFLSLMELIHPDDKREFMRALWKWSVGNSDYKVDFRLLKGENNIRWITARGKVEYNIYSKPVSISGVFQDITERKNYEEEINKLSMVARHTSNLVIISDEKRRIQWVNKSFYNLTGYTTEEVIGQTPKMFQFEKTNPDTVKYIREKLDAGESVIKTEILNRGKYGREYWLELNIVPIFNGNNDISGYIAVETDITENLLYSDSLSVNLNPGDKLTITRNATEGDGDVVIEGEEGIPISKHLPAMMMNVVTEKQSENNEEEIVTESIPITNFFLRPNKSTISKRLRNLPTGTIEITVNKKLTLDYFVFVTDLRTSKTKTLPLLTATHSKNGNIRNKLIGIDQNYAEMYPTERIDLSFGTNTTTGNRAYILKTVGRYETDTAFIGKQNNLAKINEQPIVPTENKLYDNYPNPFNPSTTIKYSLKDNAVVSLKIFNILGEEIRTLVNEIKPAGNYEVEFNASNLPSGVYIYSIQAGEFVSSKKMLMIK